MYYDRYENATTSKALNKINEDHIVLCHNNSDKFKNIYGKLIETGAKKGIQNNFNKGLDMLDLGEWGIFLSDDYIESKKIEGKSFVKCCLSDLFIELKRVISLSDKAGIKLIGFNSTGNALYANKKFGKFGLVDGRFFAIKKTDFRFNEDISTIPDYYATVEHIKRYKGNLIINKMFANFGRYKKGGLGTIEDRIGDKIHDVNLMKKLYPNNVQIKDKDGQPKGSHIVIKR